MNFKTCWLTVNRACNLRCCWCYARETNYVGADMTLSDAKKAIDICKDLKIKKIILIGGEPTLHDGLIDIIKYAKNYDMTTALVTNGIKLCNEIYIDQLIDAGLSQISMSLKGHDRESFKEITNADSFNYSLSAIKLLSRKNINFTISMVITLDNINTFLKGIEKSIQAGAKRFSLSFCFDFNMGGECNEEYIKHNNPYLLAKKFKTIYPKLHSLTHGKFNLSQSLPLCCWDSDLIKLMDARHQLSSICQLLRRGGLIFETNMDVFPCNSMYQLKLGSLGKEFNNAKELLNFYESKEVVKIYDKLCAPPSEKCVTCDMYEKCGGGCVTFWTNFNFKEFEQMKYEKGGFYE